MIKIENLNENFDEVKDKSYFRNLNNFLYKFLSFNIIINLLLYYISNEIFAVITYVVILIFFFINFRVYFRNFFIVLFAHCLVLFLINLTYLTFIGTFLVNNFIFNRSLEDTMINFFYCDLQTYFLANIYILVYSFSIIIFNNLLPSYYKITAIKKISFIDLVLDKKKIFILILLCIFFELFFYLTDMVGSQQSGGFILKNQSDKSTWYTQFYIFVVIFHIFLNVIFLVSCEKTKFIIYDKLFLFVSFVLSLIFFGFYERRLIIIFFVINFFIYFLISKKKIFSFKKILIYLFSFFIIFQSFAFLNTIRALTLVSGTDSLRTIIQKGEIFSYFKDEKINKYGKSEFRENLSFRMFNNHELATLFYYQRQDSKETLNGELLFNSFIKMIPAVIYPDKNKLIAGESLIMKITDSPLYRLDTVDSLHSYSYADLGFLGLVIYPIVVNIVFFVIYKIISIKKILSVSSVYIVAILCPLITIRAIEGTFIDWFIIMRNIILFIFLFNFLLSFIIQRKFEIKNEN